MKKAETWIRCALLSMASSVGLYVFFTFFSAGVLGSSLFNWYRQECSLFHSYVILPWGVALCLLRLKNRTDLSENGTRWDVRALFLLVAWIIVPFALRFGMTSNNVGSWHGYTVVYFGIYAFLSEKTARERERELDVLVALSGLLALVLCSALLYCAAHVLTITVGDGPKPFGLARNVSSWNLCHGLHYNSTGMVGVCLLMLCLCGFARAKNMWMRIPFAVGTVMTVLVVVLSQSRTSRYAMLIALAAGTYSVIAGRVKWKKEFVRQAAALAAAGVVLVGGYALADELVQVALRHYTNVVAQQNAEVQPMTVQTTESAPQAEVQPAESAPQAEAQPTENTQEVETPKAREAVDSTFSERTLIWSNLFKLWRENPKYLLIGNGVGRTGGRIVAGTMHEARGSIEIHNTYLQYIADFGLVGFGLLIAFLCTMLVPVLRVFFARGENRTPGYTALCMLVMACLLTGMMESQPLGCMTMMNVMMFFALALLARRGRELGRVVK